MSENKKRKRWAPSFVYFFVFHVLSGGERVCVFDSSRLHLSDVEKERESEKKQREREREMKKNVTERER